MNPSDAQPIARSHWSGWFFAAAILLEAAWIALLTVLAVVR
jgi:hypothetical protein